MDSTEKLYAALGEYAAAVTIWEARGEGQVPAEIREQGRAALGALNAITSEAEAARRKLTAELDAAGHVPLDGPGSLPVRPSRKPADQLRPELLRHAKNHYPGWDIDWDGEFTATRGEDEPLRAPTMERLWTLIEVAQREAVARR